MSADKGRKTDFGNDRMLPLAILYRWLSLRVGAVLVSRPDRWERRAGVNGVQPRHLPWVWQMAAGLAVAATSPMIWTLMLLLARDPRSDHPAFWMGLPPVVMLAACAAAWLVSRAHRRLPFVRRDAVAACYVGVAVPVGAMLFLLLGWGTGFLSEVLLPLSGGLGATALGRSMVMTGAAMVFSLLAFCAAGPVHARIAYRLTRGITGGITDGIADRVVTRG